MLAILNAELHTCGPAGTIRDGVVLIEKGKIAQVGHDLQVPEEANVVDANGMAVTPGFVDAHTHLGVSWQELAGEADTNENTSAVNPHLRVLDSVDPTDVAFGDAMMGGVTTAMVHPGKLMIGKQTISPIAGQSVVLKTAGEAASRTVLREPAGLKLALGAVKESAASIPDSPNTSMGVCALIRRLLREAQAYRDRDAEPARDLRLETLARLLSGDVAAHVHVHRTRDIRAALELAGEFGLDLVLQHATEAHLMAEELAAHNTPCVVGPITIAREAKEELKNLSYAAPGILAAAGVKVALMTDHPTEPIQFLPIIAGEAVREGMSWDDALKAITINAAEIIGVDDQVGSIEVGKDADLVVHDGDPLEAATRIRVVVADGDAVVDTLR